VSAEADYHIFFGHRGLYPLVWVASANQHSTEVLI